MAFTNASGSRRGNAEKKSRLPDVRVLLPAPLGPAMKITTGGFNLQAARISAQRLLGESLRDGGDLPTPLLSRLQPASWRIRGCRCQESFLDSTRVVHFATAFASAARLLLRGLGGGLVRVL